MNIERKLITIALTLFLTSITSAWAITRTITDSNDNLDTYIINSNGNYYEATETGLEQALNDTGCTKVELPANCNITTSTIIPIPSNIEIYGHGNTSILFLQKDGDENILVNNDQTNGNTGIYIHDLKIEGNNQNQPDDSTNQVIQNRANGIYFKHVTNSRIEHVTIFNTSCSGIVSWYGRNNTYVDNYIMNCGSHQTDTADWLPCGILCFNELDSIICYNYIGNCYGNGITTETKDADGWSSSVDMSQNIDISHNHISECYFGVYIEHVENHTISYNFIHDCNRIYAYQPDTHPGGIRLGSSGANKNVNTTIISYNILSSNGNLSSNNGWQIYFEGNGNQITHNILYNSPGFGIYNGEGYNNQITDNEIYTAQRSGIYSASFNTQIMRNTVKDVGIQDVSIVSSCIAIEQSYFAGGNRDNSRGSKICDNTIEDSGEGGISFTQAYTLVSGNSITNTGGRVATNNYAGIYGVWADNITITDNIIVNNTVSANSDGIYIYDCYDVILSDNNIVGFADGIDMPSADTAGDYHVYTGNKANRCTNGYDINIAHYNCTGNMGAFTW